MPIVDCASLAAVGRWDLGRCCHHCHRDGRPGPLDVDPELLPVGVALYLCCSASTQLCLLDFILELEDPAQAAASGGFVGLPGAEGVGA